MFFTFITIFWKKNKYKKNNNKDIISLFLYFYYINYVVFQLDTCFYANEFVRKKLFKSLENCNHFSFLSFTLIYHFLLFICRWDYLHCCLSVPPSAQHYFSWLWLLGFWLLVWLILQVGAMLSHTHFFTLVFFLILEKKCKLISFQNKKYKEMLYRFKWILYWYIYIR